MTAVPHVPTSWLVELVNGYGSRPRAAAARTDEPYPDLGPLVDLPGATTLGERGLVDLADRLWLLFASTDPSERATVMNDLLVRSRLTPYLDHEARTCWSTSVTAPDELLAAGCATTLMEVLAHGGWRRLGTCEGEDCQDAHLDLPGRSRRYCSTTCLNRARVRAYRARRR
ncbi:CGNR zinc finger protein [Actinomycetospora succinea]|uniref:CGNR zinc finger protein n=1 Tax=Actinomycetospora succinea TaxID=663603 RepID=A0A4R6V962_9PSEU|nr:CGNR zinc finger domain-containing protein [Actinomycetospora succinea]TDQ58377.1 CGNR zinc finger protein [Actinomycetospora succinea]